MTAVGEINNLGKLNLSVKQDVLDDILSFHQKTTYLLDERFARYGQFPISMNALAQLEFTDNEISPFFHSAIPVKAHETVNIRRDTSHTFFMEKKMDFADLQTLLCESFAMNSQRKRPYPSGGGLYPAEVLVLIMDDRMKGAPGTGVYHFRPSHSVLQKLKSATTEDFYRHVIIESVEEIGKPSVVFVYAINLQKAIVKYNYRGYRNAMLEVGSMYQQADLVSQALKMRNRLSSSFSDQGLLKFLELDRQVYMPLVMQYFGY